MVVMLALRVGAWWPPVGARESGIKVQDLGFSHDGMGWQRNGPEGSQVKGCGSRIVDLTRSFFLELVQNDFLWHERACAVSSNRR